MLAVAWVDLVQLIVLFTGGFIVSLFSIHKAGGWSAIVAADPTRARLFCPLSNHYFSYLAMIVLFFCVMIWYGCANQLMVQKCFAAKNEDHARKGLVWWAFLAYWKPLLFVIPGMAGYVLVQKHMLTISQPDQIYPAIVEYLIPSGLRGLIFAALMAAIVSTISNAVNTIATITHMDLLTKFGKMKMTEQQEMNMGRIISGLCFIIGIGLAIYLMKLSQAGEFEGIFAYIQSIYSYVAAPFTVIFLSAIFLKNTNYYGAMATGIIGIMLGPFLQKVAFKYWLHYPSIEENWLYCTGIAFVLCWIIMLLVSYFTKNKITHTVKVWDMSYLRQSTSTAVPLFQNYLFWFVFVTCIGIGIYIKFW